jgi:hypothetical protein
VADQKVVIERVPRGDGVNVDERVHYVGSSEVAEAVHGALNDQNAIHGFYERMQRFDVQDLGQKKD